MKVYRMPKGAELVLGGEEGALWALHGAVSVRTASGKLERLPEGTLLLRAGARSPDRRVLRALELMRAAPRERWTVARLARAVGLSRAVLARRFAAACGRSPVRCLTELRLSRAVVLLEQGEASLAEIASAVGYASEFAFSRAFKRVHGVATERFQRLARATVPVLLAA
jgi:transcriptional regulator GlxA family with amidase domain